MDDLPVLSACRWYLRGDSHHLGFYVLATIFPLSVDGAVYPLLLTIYVIFFVFDSLSVQIFGLQAWYIASFLNPVLKYVRLTQLYHKPIMISIIHKYCPGSYLV